MQGAKRRAETTSLSTMAKELLGKPVNKAMQTSDWEARPLSPRQLDYAALDAHVSVQIYDALTTGSIPSTTPMLPDLAYQGNHSSMPRNPQNTSGGTGFKQHSNILGVGNGLSNGESIGPATRADTQLVRSAAPSPYAYSIGSRAGAESGAHKP